MTEEITNIADIIASHSSRDNSLYESATKPGAAVLELDRDKLHHSAGKKRMAELVKIAELQKTVLHRMLDSHIDKPGQTERPHLTIAK